LTVAYDVNDIDRGGQQAAIALSQMLKKTFSKFDYTDYGTYL